ncbi:DNA polymerase I [Schaalia sp. 19OD2882]|uniref:DNA polymerase I n=1 Tax=Schaalia sp. 19OD2882 TaxID=2794089 RepID=UPI0020A7D418|nr:DNA polymerase I [Schaalia sp. 19OD2882]
MGSRVSCVKDTLLIIDGHSMAFRAFYALPADGFRTSTGQHTNAVYGFVSMLVRLLEQEKPEYVAVAFDVSRHSFRTEEYPEYKGTRDATPEEFKGQVGLIRQILGMMGIVSLSKEGYEADDILATLARRAADEGMRVLVASGDRDTFQTVTDRVTVLYPGQGAGDLRPMTPEAIEAKYGVPPQRYPELAALVGETSDNLPGVPGVGPKTAAQWIQQFDGLENLLARADQIGGKRGQALRDHMEDVRRNRRLNRLLTDLDLEVGPQDLRRGGTDRGALEGLFDTLEFGGLRKRVMQVAVAGPTEAAEPTVAQEMPGPVEEPVVVLGSDAADIESWAEQVGADEPLALWVEGRSAPAAGRVDRIVLATRTRALVVEDPALLDSAAERALHDLVTGSTDLTCADWKGAWHACRSLGWDLPAPAFDVSLAAYVLRPEQRSYEAPDLVSRILGTDPGGQEGATDALFEGDGSGAASEGPDSSQKRSALLAASLLALRMRLESELAATGATDLVTGMEIPVSLVLARMEALGIAADSEELAAQSTGLGQDMESARQAAVAALPEGTDVNLASPKQLQHVLFDVLALPKTKKTKTGWTTNAEALQDLFERTGNEFLSHLLAHRERTKLKQMVDSLLSCVAEDGRIHTTFSQVVAATGRLASADPNLQNIPARTPDGLRIRSGFVAGDGFEALMSADYSQIEMRIMAHLSEDAGLVEAFNSGEDLHRTMAAMVFGVPVDEVSSEQRSRIKATSYGLAYGLSSYGLSAQLRIPVGEAATLRERYFERFGGVRDYLARVVEQARRNGWTQTMFGRRRYLPDLTSENRQRREMAERAALNAPIQGSAADIIKMAMVEVDRRIREAGLGSRLLLQIHDELLLDVAPGEREQLESIVREAMASPVAMSVPLEVAVGVGGDWMAAAH